MDKETNSPKEQQQDQTQTNPKETNSSNTGGADIDKKSLAEHNRLQQIGALLNREQPGKRSR